MEQQKQVGITKPDEPLTPMEEKLQQFDKLETKEGQQGMSKEEIEAEKKKIIQQIKDLEEDYYHPEKTMTQNEIDNITNDLLKHPLFLKEIPENIEDNEHLKALQSIIYDDEPENIAKYCCEKGNELFKKGLNKSYFMSEAYKKYTEGIEAEGRDQIMNSKLYNNRALIEIKKKNFGRAVKDCKEAILCNPSFVKPYYRCAQALIYLMKYKEAIVLLEKAQKMESTNKDITKLLSETKVKYDKELLKEQGKKDVKKQEQNILFNALKIRNIHLGKAIMDFPDSCRKTCWVDENDGSLHFPTFVQYPEFQQMDYIQDIQENHQFQAHVENLIGGEGLPYDSQKIYRPDNVELYIELNQTECYYEIKDQKSWPRGRGLLKIDTYKKMNQIMATRGFILPKVAEFYMVCPDSKDFYEHFKKHFDFVSVEEIKFKASKK